MNPDTKSPRKSPSHDDPRRAGYSTPILKEFGSVGALTQAGTGGMSEAMGMGISGSSMQDRP